MHNPLTELPMRVVPDTNVLLDAAFVTDGQARQSVDILPLLGFNIILCDTVETEAAIVLRRLRIKLGLPFDPFTIFQRYLSTLTGLRVPPAAPLLGQGVNKADQHIAAAARFYGAWVLTGDAPFIVEARKTGIDARFPWDIKTEFATRHGREASLDIIRVVPPSRRTGLIFARVIPGDWKGLSNVGQFTVCEIGNVGRVYYDTKSGSWMFSMVTGATAEAKCRPKQDGWWAVCATYVLPGSGKQGTITIRAASSSSSPVSGVFKTLHNLRGNSAGTMTFGHSINGENHWNGWVRAVVVGPQSMNTKTWNALIAVPEGAPNPYDADALERALKILGNRFQSSLKSFPLLLERDLV